MVNDGTVLRVNVIMQTKKKWGFVQSENYPKYVNKILRGFIFSDINLDKIEIKEFITLHEQYLFKKNPIA